MTRFLMTMLALVLGSVSARAEIVTKPFEYKHGTTVLEGLVAFDAGKAGKRPGVLLVHEHGATSVLAKSKAVQLAKLGYVVFSADLYGKGVAPKDAADAAAKLGLTGKDRTLIRERTAVAR